MRGAKVDGVISIAAAHHGTVDKMRDTTRARSEWQQVIKGLKPGPAIVVVNFADDAYDVGGRMADAKRGLRQPPASPAWSSTIPTASRAMAPAASSTFARKFGPCIVAFVETRKKQPPCGD